MTNLELILKRFFAKYKVDYSSMTEFKDAMYAAYAEAIADGYTGTFGEWLNSGIGVCHVHGADIYIQTTEPIAPQVGDLWYDISNYIRV